MPVRFYFTLIARSRTHQHHADSSIAAHLRYADRKKHIESQYAPLHSTTIDSLPPSPSRMPQNLTWPFLHQAFLHQSQCADNQVQRILFTKKLGKNFADLKTCRTFAIANTKATINGAVVQLVRIHACHAWGRGFESRPHRRNPETKVSGFFVFRSISATLQHKILRKSAKVGKAAIQTARCASKEVHNVWQSASRQYRHRGSPQSGRIDAATLCAIGEVHNVDPLSVNPGPRPGHNAGTTRTATRCRCIWMEKKKARQSDELCFLVASMKQHLQT